MGRYYVLCDECKTIIRRTDSLHESACGGHCDECNAKLDALYPSRKANREALRSAQSKSYEVLSEAAIS